MTGISAGFDNSTRGRPSTCQEEVETQQNETQRAVATTKVCRRRPQGQEGQA